MIFFAQIVASECELLLLMARRCWLEAKLWWSGWLLDRLLARREHIRTRARELSQFYQAAQGMTAREIIAALRGGALSHSKVLRRQLLKALEQEQRS